MTITESKAADVATLEEVKAALVYAKQRGAVALDGVPVSLLEELFRHQCPCPACVEFAFAAIHQGGE